MRLPDGQGEHVELFRGPELRMAVLDRFPELAPGLGPDVGIHAIVSTLGRMLVSSAHADGFERVRSITSLLETLLDRRDLDPEIPNAIAISFVTPDELRATAPGKQIWLSMPTRLRRLIEGQLMEIG